MSEHAEIRARIERLQGLSGPLSQSERDSIRLLLTTKRLTKALRRLLNSLVDTVPAQTRARRQAQELLREIDGGQ